MSKARYQDPVSDKDKKKFAPYLSEDEELVLVTGYGTTYLRSRAIVWILWPGIFVIVAVAGVIYYRNSTPESLGYGILAGMGVSALLGVIQAWRTHHANRYLLTTRRVIIKKGVLSVKLVSALYDKITHIEVDQSFLDKILMHHGNLYIHTAGSEKDEMVLKFIEYPIEFKNALERLINRERKQFNQSTPLHPFEGELVEH